MGVHRDSHLQLRKTHLGGQFVLELFEPHHRRPRLRQFPLDQWRQDLLPDFLPCLPAAPVDHPPDPFGDDQSSVLQPVRHGHAPPINFSLLIFLQHAKVSRSYSLNRARRCQNGT